MTIPTSEARAAAILAAAVAAVFDENQFVTVEIRELDKTAVSVTGELNQEYDMQFPAAAMDGLLMHLTGLLANETAAVLSVTIPARSGNRDETETWAWHLPETTTLSLEEVTGLLGPDVHHIDLRHHRPLNGGTFALLDGSCFTEDVKALLYRRGIADYEDRRPADSGPHRPGTTNGDVLRDALTAAEIAHRTDSDASGYWIAVDLDCGATIRVSSHGSVGTPATAHRGWVARFHPDGAARTRHQEIYSSDSADIAADTTAVVSAVTESMHHHSHQPDAEHKARIDSTGRQLDYAHSVATEARENLLVLAATYVGSLLRPHLPGAAAITFDATSRTLRAVRNDTGEALWSAPCHAVGLPAGLIEDVVDVLGDALGYGTGTAALADAGWTSSDEIDQVYDVVLPQE
ncbi:hypothetical protein ACFV3E_40890 [Streptomyces sp. NPDC059718]